ncbi:MAG: DUF1343 domain-containing protein [Gemmatimonadota bacterium]|nr:DUF1343 domain-containing protein [Gemmatimonadota bacterium]MDE3005341.1 DUF1343 domain-containing protein [Gemmatimonadota bacterium]MDE3012466.1 DUF1343 domain-containing protein [Gemmatimonadota bacterium]
MAISTAGCGVADEAATDQATHVIRPGVEVLISDSLHLVSGKRVGLVTNHTGIDRTGRTDIDILADHPDVDLVALYSPEHGIRGEERAGAAIESGVDEQTGLPIHSLYGETRKPTPAMLANVDVLVFDMQDIGARYYTYVSTMALAMEAAGENGIPFLVLDRPNPIRGDVVQGNVLDPEYSTFVGMYEVPMRHGMTPGELARMYVGAFGISADLTVVPVDGWTREMTFDDTGLPWVAPSPNMPDLTSALAYPGTCLFEGTPISVGRGTDRAFQWIGAPWLDGSALAEALNSYGIDGVRFEAVTFTPTDAGDRKFEGVTVEGVRLVAERTDYDASRAAVAMLIETYRASGDNWEWYQAHFDRLAGTDALRHGLVAGVPFAELVATWDADVSQFESARAPYLIY